MNSIDKLMSQDSSVYARYLIGRVSHKMFWAQQKEMAQNHITPRQAYVLFVLANLGHTATLAELSKYTERGVSNISIQLTRMEKDGLVKKTRETPKSALLKFELTEKGSNLEKRCNIKTSDKTIMSVLSEEERQQLISMMNKLRNKAIKYKGS